MDNNLMDNKKKQSDWSDQISLLRMSCLTSIGRAILPPGFWGDTASASASASATAATATSGKESRGEFEGEGEGESGKQGEGGKQGEDRQKRRGESGRAGATASGGKLYLTFDDGPNPDTTPHLLKLLAEEKVPATFFLIGEQITRHLQLGIDIVEAGHSVGNHSYKHEFMPGMPLKRITEEIHRTNDLLRQISSNRAPKLFRPPFGILDKRTADCARAAGLSLVYWTIVPEDWEHVGAERIVSRVSRKMSAGSIIVLHEGSTIAGQTIEATRQIIKRARDRGMEFSALPELGL